jgi:hypothetical protein
MKRLISAGLALLIALFSLASAYAMEVPTETIIRNLNGAQEYIKVYTVSPDIEPESLIEPDFSYEGFDYSYSAMTKSDNYYENEIQHSEVITAETEKKDLSSVLEALPPAVDYDDGIYTGTLYLDHTTIETKAAGFVSKSYTMSETREYANLDSNDMSYVPQTITKDGKALQLVGVDWQVQETALVDDLLSPSSYKAVASYAAKASYNAATGYVSTATYTGSISCNQLESVTYTVTYAGSEIQPEPEEVRSYVPVRDQKYRTIGLIVLIALIIAIAIGVIAFFDYMEKRKTRVRSKKAEKPFLRSADSEPGKEEKKCEEEKYY